MPDDFRLAVDAQNVELKAYARHFEHPEEEAEGDETRHAVLIVVASMSFPDSGWNVIVTPVEGTRAEEWIVLEDPPSFRDEQRTFYAVAGNTLHQVAEVPETIRVKYGDQVTRVSVAPWD